MENKKKSIDTFLERIIFASRWFQAPMYFGLIVGGCIYAWRFMVELFQMICDQNLDKSNILMMAVLNLVDIAMIGQLLIMVIIGGWHTFVSKIDMIGEDKPEWLDTVNAGILKVKMATSLVNISGIQLLSTFMYLKEQIEKNQSINDRLVIYQIAIHITFLFSAIMLSWVEKLTDHKH